MAKKKNAKKRANKGRVTHHSSTTSDTEKVLVENFVSLQKVITNLSIKFDSLATQISKLLELFEISAKVLAEKDYEVEKSNKENIKILEKIENVLEQNKTIAKGLTLMHEKINPSPSYPPQMRERPAMPTQQKSPPPYPQNIQKNSMVGGVSEEYHRQTPSNEQQ